MELTETFKKIRPACVAIALLREDNSHVSYTIFGSGVCVHSRGYILTAKHVVTDYYRVVKRETAVPDRAPSRPEFVVVFSGRTNTEYQSLYSKPFNIWLSASDIAVVQIPEKPGGWPSVGLPNEWHTWEGASVAAVGYPLRDRTNQNIAPNLFQGIVSQVNGHFVGREGFKVDDLVVDVSLHPGNSGGPVFDTSTGELIAIVSKHTLADLDRDHGNEDEELLEFIEKHFSVWTNITHCVPWTDIVNSPSGFDPSNLPKMKT